MAAEQWQVSEPVDEAELRRRRRHERAVAIGDAADIAGQWTVAVFGIAVAAVIAGAVSGLTLLWLLDLIGGWLR